MKFKFLCTFLLILLLVACDSQPETVSENPKDYYKLNDELQDIGNILSEKDIVIIGESTHWSTDITEEKIKLIDYLA